MIEFELMDACENCAMFEVEQLHMRTIVEGDEMIYRHSITCKHLGKCATLLDHLKKEVNKNGK